MRQVPPQICTEIMQLKDYCHRNVETISISHAGFMTFPDF